MIKVICFGDVTSVQVFKTQHVHILMSSAHRSYTMGVLSKISSITTLLMNLVY